MKWSCERVESLRIYEIRQEDKIRETRSHVYTTGPCNNRLLLLPTASAAPAIMDGAKRPASLILFYSLRGPGYRHHHHHH